MEGEGVSVRTKKDLVGETETLVLGEELNSVKDESQNHNGPLEDKIGEKEVEVVDKTNVEEVPVVVNGKESEHISSVFSTEDEDEDEDDLVLFNRHEGQRDSLSPETVLTELENVREERDSLIVQLSRKESEDSLRERSFQEIAKELESKCFTQQEQIDLLQEQLAVEQEKSQASVASLQKELALRVNQVTKMYEEAVMERESVVTRLSVMDKERRELIDAKEDNHKKIRELNKNVEKLQNQVKSEKAEVAKQQATAEKHELALKERCSELSKVQEELSSANIKLKWTQNKLKTETEGHENTKKQLQNTMKKFTQAKEEGEQLRADLKATIKTYQESEEMKSNSLGIRLKKTEDELRQNEKEKADHLRMYDVTKRELDSVKKQLQELEEEHKMTVDKLQHVEKQLAEQNQSVMELTGTNSRQAERIGNLKLQVKEGEKAKKELDSVQAELEKCNDEIADLTQSCVDLQDDLASCKLKEKELLSFTEKLTSSNAELQAMKTSLEQKVSSMGVDNAAQSQYIASMEMKSREVEDDLAQTIKKKEGRIVELELKLDDKGRAVEQLSMDLEDAHNQVRVHQRKNASSLKDLTKQLQHYRKQLERVEKGGAPTSPMSPTSPSEQHHTSSGSSKVFVASLTKTSAPTTGSKHSTNSTSSLVEGSGEDEVRFSQPSRRKKVPLGDTSTLPVDKSVIVDKLCRAQRRLAKMEEKLDFYEEHSRQLTEDIQKKARIIQFYVTREESGTLAPSSSEENKASLAQRGGIMASLYQSKAVDSHMTLELSLEISRKLQAVLEDTLLKNITLKESIETLGREIARLSQELQQSKDTS